MTVDNYPENVGFRAGSKGTHSSRTMMLSEVSELLSVVRVEANRSAYFHEVIEENVLGKVTTSTRRATAQRLSELYGLDRRIPIFRAMRRFWDPEAGDRSVIAVLVSLARDPLLRATVDSVLGLREGQAFDKGLMRAAIARIGRDRLNASSVEKIIRNAASSWTQSGHLEGRTLKRRASCNPSHGAVAMALFLGFLQGHRGPGILRSIWCRVLDRPEETIVTIASTASLRGLIRFRHSGEVLEVGFPNLLSKSEMESIYESHRNSGEKI